MLTKLRRALVRPVLHAPRARSSVALLLGSVLSIGGIAETLGDVQFLVQKNAEGVRVVRIKNDQQRVLADLDAGLAGNTVFRLARVLPNPYVKREMRIFDPRWTATAEWPQPAPQPDSDVYFQEMRRVNDRIRARYFAARVPYGALIYEKARKYDVDPALVAAVIEHESYFEPRMESHAGARGLMQIMPSTGRLMGARDLYDPEQNVDAGVKYIKYLHERFGGDLKKTLAAYNGGEANVARYGGIPPFPETRQYVRKVIRSYGNNAQKLAVYEREQTSGR